MQNGAKMGQIGQKNQRKWLLMRKIGGKKEKNGGKINKLAGKVEKLAGK